MMVVTTESWEEAHMAHIATLLHQKGDFVATCSPDTTIRDVLAGLAEHGVGALVVTDDAATIIGIVSERDIVRALHSRGVGVLDDPVSTVMTTPVHTCGPDDPIDSLFLVMTERRIRHVPVVRDGAMVGIVSIGDVVKHRVGELEHENQSLVQYIQTGR
jgi:CBS domain-containing protein